MRKEDSRDPLMDRSHAPSAAWERSLRPARTSGWVWVSLGVVAAAVAAYLAFQAWQASSRLADSDRRRATPAVSPKDQPSSARQAEPRQLPPESLPQRTQRFAKCTSPVGATTYSDGPCPSGTKAGDVWVRPDLNLADGMSDDARQASMRNNSAIARSVVEHERRVAMNVDDAASECPQLNALIASIDAAARQPLPGYEQDRLKDQRMHARSRQSALHCR